MNDSRELRKTKRELARAEGKLSKIRLRNQIKRQQLPVRQLIKTIKGIAESFFEEG